MMTQLEVVRGMVLEASGPCRCKNNEDFCGRCLAQIDLAQLKEAGITPYFVGNMVEGLIDRGPR